MAGILRRAKLHAAIDALEDRLKLAEFRRKNEIAEEQSRNGESIELDEEDLYRRLQERFVRGIKREQFEIKPGGRGSVRAGGHAFRRMGATTCIANHER